MKNEEQSELVYRRYKEFRKENGYPANWQMRWVMSQEIANAFGAYANDSQCQILGIPARIGQSDDLHLELVDSTTAAGRVRRFLDARATMGGLDPEVIAEVACVYTNHQIVKLTVFDLRALLESA